MTEAVAMDSKHHNCEQSSACQEQSNKRKLERGKDKEEGKRIKYLVQFILSLSLLVLHEKFSIRGGLGFLFVRIIYDLAGLSWGPAFSRLCLSAVQPTEDLTSSDLFLEVLASNANRRV